MGGGEAGKILRAFGVQHKKKFRLRRSQRKTAKRPSGLAVLSFMGHVAALAV